MKRAVALLICLVAAGSLFAFEPEPLIEEPETPEEPKQPEYTPEPEHPEGEVEVMHNVDPASYEEDSAAVSAAETNAGEENREDEKQESSKAENEEPADELKQREGPRDPYAPNADAKEEGCKE